MLDLSFIRPGLISTCRYKESVQSCGPVFRGRPGETTWLVSKSVQVLWTHCLSSDICSVLRTCLSSDQERNLLVQDLVSPADLSFIRPGEKPVGTRSVQSCGPVFHQTRRDTCWYKIWSVLRTCLSSDQESHLLVQDLFSPADLSFIRPGEPPVGTRSVQSCGPVFHQTRRDTCWYKICSVLRTCLSSDQESHLLVQDLFSPVDLSFIRPGEHVGTRSVQSGEPPVGTRSVQSCGPVFHQTRRKTCWYKICSVLRTCLSSDQERNLLVQDLVSPVDLSFIRPGEPPVGTRSVQSCGPVFHQTRRKTCWYKICSVLRTCLSSDQEKHLLVQNLFSPVDLSFIRPGEPHVGTKSVQSCGPVFHQARRATCWYKICSVLRTCLSSDQERNLLVQDLFSPVDLSFIRPGETPVGTRSVQSCGPVFHQHDFL